MRLEQFNGLECNCGNKVITKCPPNGVACWHGFRLNNLACPTNPSSLDDLQSYLSVLSKNLAAGMQYSNAELLSLVDTANQKVMAIQ
ncbi:MAG: hypothetical protein QM487_08625 [Candidatus Marithrix sp.]